METDAVAEWAVIIQIALLVGCISGLVGGWVASQCGRSRTEGAVLGFLLGPFGVLIEALLPRNRQ